MPIPIPRQLGQVCKSRRAARHNPIYRQALAAGLVATLMASCEEMQPDSPDGGGSETGPTVENVDDSGVKIQQAPDSVIFIEGGKSFRIRGAGGPASLEKLAAAGANATRTWGFDQLENGLLDEAHRHGLKVSVGIWIRHDLDYQDDAQVAEQIRLALDGVQKYKDHPAVLVWGIGNEMEGDGSRIEVWKLIEEIARRIKTKDPHHPTMTTIAEIGGEKVPNIHRHCPSIDIVGINAYGGAASIPKRYREAGGKKPYILTEYGPRGPWDLPRNEIGSVDEELGSIKAATYLESYRAVDGDRALCLGSLAFMWGHKQEATPTWFGMFLADGRKTAAVDVLSEAWSGRPVADRCPQIKALTLTTTGPVKDRSTVSATLDAHDPEGRELTVDWVLMEDAKTHFTGGYQQATPPTFEENIVEASQSSVTFRVPDKPGLYRIFAYVGDGGPGADAANVVFRAVR